jgi:aspartyl aminopeptidase
VKVQTYCNRADLPGGSTLGSISNTRVSVPTVDIGLPQLAMHSANETAGAHDVEYMISALTEFYSSSIYKKGSKVYF